MKFKNEERKIIGIQRETISALEMSIVALRQTLGLHELLLQTVLATMASKVDTAEVKKIIEQHKPAATETGQYL